MFNINEAQKRRTVRLLWFAILALIAVIAGLLFFNHWLIQRAGEDAYATMLWKQSAKTAECLEQYVRTVLSDMAGMVSDDAGTGLLETERADDVFAMRRWDAAGQPAGEWTQPASARTAWPDNLSSECLDQLRRQLPVLDFCVSGSARQACVLIHAPITRQGTLEGAISLAISPETVIRRCFPPMDEPLIAGFALRDQSNRIILDFARPDYAGHIREFRVIRAEPLFTEPEQGNDAYKVVSHNGARYLSAAASVLLPGGTSWRVETFMPYSTVSQAPRALFKSLVIICAWLFPACGFLLLFTVYRLLHAVENDETSRTRDETEQLQSQMVAIIDSTPDVTAIMIPASTPELVFISRNIEHISGYVPIELIANQPLWNKLPEQAARSRVVQARQAAIQTKTIQTVEYQISGRTGQKISVGEHITPICDHTDKVVRLLAIIRLHLAEQEPMVAEMNNSVPQSTASPEGAADQPRRQVLFADDDRLLTSLCAMYLARAGYGITIAYNGLQAVDQFQSRPDFFDLIILDMIMPEMSGLEAITHLRTIKPEVKIIGISGYSQDGAEWGSFRHNVAAFLPKPFQPEELLRAMADTLDDPTVV